VEMLEAASRGVIVPNPHRPALAPLAGEADGRIIRAEAPGPAGWSEALRRVLSEMGLEMKGETGG
jgi:mannosyl-3-phosphoglycerate phosphatase